jgi:hypothetical protein
MMRWRNDTWKHRLVAMAMVCIASCNDSDGDEPPECEQSSTTVPFQIASGQPHIARSSVREGSCTITDCLPGGDHATSDGGGESADAGVTTCDRIQVALFGSGGCTVELVSTEGTSFRVTITTKFESTGYTCRSGSDEFGAHRVIASPDFVDVTFAFGRDAGD